ncbi:MAG: agmatine deiminase family protein [Elusimicrobiales bacterium]|nr:agmatine deiminase family protein [Elusimicrobiales bacterium]
MRKVFFILTLIQLTVFNINASENNLNKDFIPPTKQNIKDSTYEITIPNPADLYPSYQNNNYGDKKGPSEAQKQLIKLKNKSILKNNNIDIKFSNQPNIKYRPYADYEKTGYLIFTSEFRFNSKEAKKILAKNIPQDAKLILIINPYNQKETDEALSTLTTVIPRNRIILARFTESSKAFWARDAMPIPVFSILDNSFTVIDAKYYHEFNQDQQVASMFGAKLEKHEYYFEGGNFMANKNGDCLIVNNDYHREIPDSIFSVYYGCKKIIKLPFIEGIGHVDEHARFVNDTTILTDLIQYKTILEKEGFTVIMLPKPQGAYETYVNSVIMDGKAIVPIFGSSTDSYALSVYESVGFKAEGAPSKDLSNKGEGSVHCITMTYPPVPLKELAKALNIEILDSI